MNHKIVDYILLAEFDIDKGSTVRYQYPEQTGEDTQLLAELMLPDGAHKKTEDWTIFFLGRGNKKQKTVTKKPPVNPTPQVKEDYPIKEVEALIYEYSEANQNQGWNQLGNEKRKVQLCQQTINICSLDGQAISQIRKHKDLEYTILESLFVCVLSESGTAVGFRFPNKVAEQTFLNHLEYLITQLEEDLKVNISPANQESKITSSTESNSTSNNSTSNGEGSNNFLYCMNLVNTQKDSSVRRGAVVKAMAICSRHQFIHVFKPVIVLALQKLFSLGQNQPEEQEGILKQLYNALNSMDLSSFPILSDHRKLILRSANDKSKHEFSTSINFITKMNLKIPTTLFPDEVGDVKVTALVKKFGNQIMHIYNGLITQKRILFLGFECSAGEVSEYVLAACCMVCPPLKGLVSRAYPYTNLTYLDFLDVPGYIAGVTNPMFEQHTEWWDMLCNINTGKVTVNLNAQLPEKNIQLDNELMAEVNASISSHYGEDTVRSLFESYTQHIIDIAFDEEEYYDDIAFAHQLEGNKQRIEMWKKTISFQTYEQQRKLRLQMSAIKDPNVKRYIKKLRTTKFINDQDMINIYSTFIDNIKSEEQLVEFLSYLPESSGGLAPIAISLYHSSEAVRLACAKLFKRLDKVQTGSGFISNLNLFLVLSFDRISKQVQE